MESQKYFILFVFFIKIFICLERLLGNFWPSQRKSELGSSQKRNKGRTLVLVELLLFAILALSVSHCAKTEIAMRPAESHFLLAPSQSPSCDVYFFSFFFNYLFLFQIIINIQWFSRYFIFNSLFLSFFFHHFIKLFDRVNKCTDTTTTKATRKLISPSSSSSAKTFLFFLKILFARRWQSNN